MTYGNKSKHYATLRLFCSTTSDPLGLADRRRWNSNPRFSTHSYPKPYQQWCTKTLSGERKRTRRSVNDVRCFTYNGLRIWKTKTKVWDTLSSKTLGTTPSMYVNGVTQTFKTVLSHSTVYGQRPVYSTYQVWWPNGESS